MHAINIYFLPIAELPPVGGHVYEYIVITHVVINI